MVPRKTRSKEKEPETGKRARNPASQRTQQMSGVDQKSGFLALQQAAGNKAVNELLEASVSSEPHFMSNVPPIVETVLQRGGEPLDPAARDMMEPLFGQDFENVHVHTDTEAGASAHAVGARAYTAGQDVVFGEGQYQPQTEAGRKLLAHELGHTIQQRDAGVTSASANKSAGGIMRAPLPGAADSSFSLLSSEIPSPSITRFGSSIIATLYFGQNFFLLDSRNLEALNKLGEELRFILNPVISVDGYASSEGTEQYNQKLAENRRTTAISLLRSKVVGTATFGGEGHGEFAPAEGETAKAGSKLEAQRALNRRVTIVVSSPTAAKPAAEAEKKPITIFAPPQAKPETEEERKKREEEERRRKLKQMLDLGVITPPSRPSLTEAFWKVVDEKVDEVSRKVGVPEKYRGMVRDAAHAAIEKGAEEALDQALDLARISGPEKEAVKAAVKAAAQTKTQ